MPYSRKVRQVRQCVMPLIPALPRGDLRDSGVDEGFDAQYQSVEKCFAVSMAENFPEHHRQIAPGFGYRAHSLKGQESSRYQKSW